MASLLDGVVLNCSTTGTGTLTLGSAVAPYLTPAQAGAVSGTSYFYSIVDAAGGNFECGISPWTSGSGNGTLTRNPSVSSNSNAAISLSGTSIVRLGCVLAESFAPLTITPPANTTTQGLVITQTGPTSSQSGPLSYNLVSVTLQGAVTGSGIDAYGLDNTNSIAFRVNTTIAGGTTEAAAGLISALRVTTTSTIHDTVALGGAFYTNVVVGGTAFSEAFNAYALVDNNGSVNTLVGGEFDVGIAGGTPGGSATNRFGIYLGSTGALNASSLDAGMAITGIGSSFVKAFLLTNKGGNAPIATGGDLFYADTAYTIANVFNLSNMTVTADILNFPNYTVAGSGLTTISRNAIAATSTDALVLQNTTAATSGTANQWSPRAHWIGQLWNTTAAATETVEWLAELQSLSSNATSLQNNLVFSAQINGAGYGPIVKFQFAGSGNGGLYLNSSTGKNANLVYEDGGNNVWYLQNNGATDTLQLFNSDANGNSTRLSITQAGAIAFPGVSTTASAANAFLDNTASNNLLRSTSSIIYKRDIEPLDPAAALKVLTGARPIWYRSKCANDNPDWSWYGLGAEDMADLDPRLVHWSYRDEDYEVIHAAAGEARQRRLKVGASLKPDGVQYDRLAPHLICGWQNHEARIAALERAAPTHAA
jgi:hypothetical protein